MKTICILIFMLSFNFLHASVSTNQNYLKTGDLFYVYNRKKGVVSLYTDTNQSSFITNIKIKNKSKEIEYIRLFDNTNMMLLGRANGDYELYNISKSKKISTVVSKVSFGILMKTGEIGFEIALNSNKSEKKESRVYISGCEKYFFIHTDSSVITCYESESGNKIYSRSLDFYLKLKETKYSEKEDILIFEDDKNIVIMDVVSGDMDYKYKK